MAQQGLPFDECEEESPLEQNAVIAEYPIEAFVEKRAEISDRINTTFAEQVAGSGIQVKSLLITSHDFSDEFNKAIEDKKIAEQGALTAKFTLERMKLEAEAQKTLTKLVMKRCAKPAMKLLVADPKNGLQDTLQTLAVKLAKREVEKRTSPILSLTITDLLRVR